MPPLAVSVSRDGPVTVVRLDRPAVRNAIDARTARGLRDAFLAFDADPAASVAVLAGRDDAFCAGADLNDAAALAEAVAGPDGPLGPTRLLLGKPVVAAIAGPCVAGGLELALWCDLRVADETATFGFLERRFGVPLVDGGTIRLPAVVGLGRALEMILTGRLLDAREALAWGLVTEVVPRGTHVERAVALARRLAAFPQACLRNDRLSLYESLGLPVAEALSLEARRGAATVASGETEAGVRAFLAGKGRGGTFE